MDFGCIGAPFEVKFADDDHSAVPGTFEGYGAVFGNIDSHGDVIEPGAFAKSLLDRTRDSRGMVPMYKMHGTMTGNRQEPVGVWEAMSEDANGLHVKGRLIGLDTEQGKWTYAQLREGALKGLSIGYRIPSFGARKGSDRPGEPKRIIKSMVLREVSLVDDPSNTLSRVYLMKSRFGDDPNIADEIKTIRDFEQYLRDAGWSNTAAKAIAAGGFKAKPDPRDEDGLGSHIRERMNALATLIQK